MFFKFLKILGFLYFIIFNSVKSEDRNIMTNTSWIYEFNALEKIDSILTGNYYINKCSKTRIYQTDKYYEEDSLRKEVRHFSKKNNYISQCLDRVKEGKKVSIDKTFSFLCKKGLIDKRPSAKTSYKLEIKNGIIVLTSKLYFIYMGKRKDKDDAFKKLRQTVPCMQKFFAKHGVKLDLNIYEESNPMDLILSDRIIRLYPSGDRQTHNKWIVYNERGTVIDHSYRCSVFTHEFSHTIGLGDNYRIGHNKCPDQIMDDLDHKDDMMYNAAFRSSKSLHFMDGDLKKILDPLCRDLKKDNFNSMKAI